MLDSRSLVPDDWSGLISRVAGDLDLDALAKETRALVRRRGVPDAQALLRLALARGPGGMSLRQTAAWAHLSGVADLTDASLNDRLHQSCDLLAAIVAKLLAARAPSPCPRWPGRVLRIADGSCVSKPGSRGADWRVHGVYDLGAGGFSHLELTDKHGGEALDRGVGVEGEIRIADRGYSAAKALRRFVASVKQAKGADYVVRLRWRSFRLREPCGAKFDLIAHLQNMPKEQDIDDVRVLIEGAGDPLPTRIVIARKPEEAARAERQRRMRDARKKGKQLDPRSLIAAEYVMLATSLPENAFPASEILALYRLRWQIELAFKRLKTLLRIDCLPAKTDKGGRSWIYAHLILAIATDACSQDFLDSSPDEMIAADYAPSIWRVQKTVIMVLRIAILGRIALSAVLAAPTRFHRLLAEPPRKRKLQLQYPVRALS